MGEFWAPGAEIWLFKKKNMDRSIDLAVWHIFPKMACIFQKKLSSQTFYPNWPIFFTDISVISVTFCNSGESWKFSDEYSEYPVSLPPGSEYPEYSPLTPLLAAALAVRVESFLTSILLDASQNPPPDSPPGTHPGRMIFLMSILSILLDVSQNPPPWLPSWQPPWPHPTTVPTSAHAGASPPIETSQREDHHLISTITDRREDM